MKVTYNLKHEAIRDITPETLADIKGKTQADHNRDNTIARNKLDRVERLGLNNKAKISELEKLTIKQQTEIDFIKNTPTGFDLAQTELFTNKFGTIKSIINEGHPDAEILTDVFAPRSDGNFEFGVLKNPRSKPLSGVDRSVSLNSLFGQSVKGISYGETTNSLWIVTSDGQGSRGYLFRCSPIFIDGQLNILSYWIIDALGGNREFMSVAESLFDEKITLFVGVSDETGGGGHHLNRYRIAFDRTDNIVTIADGKESSPGVPLYKGTGDIIDGEVSSSDPELLVEKVDISEPGKLRGIEVVNQYLYIAVQEDTSASEEEIDSTGYSFIRRIKITSLGVLTSGANTFKFKFDDISEDQTNGNGTLTHYDLYGIASYKAKNLNTITGLTQDQIDTLFDNSEETKFLYLSFKHVTTNKKKIVLINVSHADITDTGNPNYTAGFQNIETILQEVEGYSSSNTLPFITSTPDRTILEVEQAGNVNILAIHDLAGFDLFQGDIKYAAKVKRYFNTENFHAQLGVTVKAVAANHTQAITSGADNDFTFTTTGGTRSRTGVTSPQTFSTGYLFHFHSYLSGEPFWMQPNFTFAVTDGVSNPVGNVKALTIKGSVNSGEMLYFSYVSGSTTVLGKVPFTSILAVSPNTGADGFTDYQQLSSSPETVTAGNIGRFGGPVSFDPVTQKLWVATNSGFIHNMTDGGSTLNFNLGNSYAVVKLYSPTLAGATLSSGVPSDGSLITSLSVYNNIAYVGMSIPNSALQAPTNTFIRVFDIGRSTSTQPLAISSFCTKGIATDMNVSDTGMFSTDGTSAVKSIFNSQFYHNVFESTEVLDEFNFFKNPIVNTNNTASLGFQITASAFMEKTKTSNSFQVKEWILPRRAMAFGLYTDASLTLNPGKLQIIDFSDLDNPVLWSEFLMVNSPSKDITQIGLSGSLLYGSGQIDAMTFVDDKLFVGRRNSGFGTHINVIDFASNAATIVVDPKVGSGNIFSGMKFGFKNAETDKTGGLNERNNPSFHYSGFVNTNVKVGPTQITDMSAAMITNKTNKNILTPYVAVARNKRDNGDLSGVVDIINANTLESIISIGPGNVAGQGSAKRIVMNSDGSVIVGYTSGLIAKIDDVRLVENDGDNYFTNFSAEKVKVWFPDGTAANSLTDMKIQHYVDVLGNQRNLVYASYGTVSGSATYAVKFVFEDVSSAGGASTNSEEFLNNAEVIYYTATSSPGPVSGIDYMDNRLFLSVNDAVNQFRMTVLKKFDVIPDKSQGYANNWFPILGDNGFIDKSIDFDDLHYNGIKAQINRLFAVQKMSLLFANTPNGSVMFKFPFVETSKWYSTVKPITQDVNAVALSRDVFIEDGVVSEFVSRNDGRIVFDGAWDTSVPSITIPYTSAPLFSAPIGGRQTRGKLLTQAGFPYSLNSFKNFQPFTVAQDNGLNIFWDGQPISNFGYDFKNNVLMIDRDSTLGLISVIDLLDISTTGAVFKPTFVTGSVISTVSLNDENSTLRFFQTQQRTLVNTGGNHESIDLNDVNIDNISSIPVVQIKTLDGRPLATFQGASNTGEANAPDLIKPNLASTEKVILDANGNPVSTIILTGNKIRSEGKFVSRIIITTFDFAITEFV